MQCQNLPKISGTPAPETTANGMGTTMPESSTIRTFPFAGRVFFLASASWARERH